MRPAREGRENFAAGERRRHRVDASMRPAREGRENLRSGTVEPVYPVASMRPAREGRENAAEPLDTAIYRMCFNEARP